MRLKITVCLTFIVVLAMASAALAAVPQIPPALVTQCEKEPPLTQKDVDSFVKMWPEMINGGDKSEAEAKKLFAKHGFTDVRATFVIMKVTNAYGMTEVVKQTGNRAMGEQMLIGMGMPKVFLPSDAEYKLVEKNAAKFKSLQGMMQ